MKMDANIAVCGAGPAGIGFLLAAYKKGSLEQLISDSLVIIDKASTLGGGDLGKYSMTANTTAGTFIEIINDSDHKNIFTNIKKSSALYREMNENREKTVSLYHVSKFLEEISAELLKYVTLKGGNVLKEEEVISCQITNEGYILTIRNIKSQQESEIYAKKVLMNLGAMQSKSTSIEILEKSDYLTGYNLKASKILTTNDIIATPNDKIDTQETISIVGASHSAFSAIEIINKNKKCKNINLIYYPPIRIQYPSVTAANEDSYTFDQELDVCPITGGVNRYGGLRFAARNIALSILKTGKIFDSEVNINLIEINKINEKKIQKHLDSSQKIVTCFGYEPNLPVFRDKSGVEFNLKMRSLGVFVDSSGGIYMENQELLQNFYAFGIGSGLSISKEIGGERSFQGRVDGVWLYQNDIGDKILESIDG